MLPGKFKAQLFNNMSVKTMRYVTSIPTEEASGLVKRVYDMIADDFFINGSLTSHSKVPPLLAGIWTAGRETILVSDHVDHTTKYAMCATLSRVNDCPYCGDMLVSLVHGSGKHRTASQIFAEMEGEVSDPVLRERLMWVQALSNEGPEGIPPAPFTEEQLPEVIGAMMAMSHINRFSHVVMDGSPVEAPMGIQGVKSAALKWFGGELKSTTERYTEPARALPLLPAATLPEDMAWAYPNKRIAAALARWAYVVEQEARKVVSPQVQVLVAKNLSRWQGEQMPMSRGWVDQEVKGLTGEDWAIARLALVIAKAPYQVDEALVEAVYSINREERRLIRILAWASFSAARRVAQRIAAAGTVATGDDTATETACISQAEAGEESLAVSP